jgi:hypothetical protein
MSGQTHTIFPLLCSVNKEYILCTKNGACIYSHLYNRGWGSKFFFPVSHTQLIIHGKTGCMFQHKQAINIYNNKWKLLELQAGVRSHTFTMWKYNHKCISKYFLEKLITYDFKIYVCKIKCVIYTGRIKRKLTDLSRDQYRIVKV